MVPFMTLSPLILARSPSQPCPPQGQAPRFQFPSLTPTSQPSVLSDPKAHLIPTQYHAPLLPTHSFFILACPPLCSLCVPAQLARLTSGSGELLQEHPNCSLYFQAFLFPSTLITSAGDIVLTLISAVLLLCSEACSVLDFQD